MQAPIFREFRNDILGEFCTARESTRQKGETFSVGSRKIRRSHASSRRDRSSRKIANNCDQCPMRTDRLDPGLKSDRRCGPPRISSSFWIQSAVRRPYEQRGVARKEGRKAEGANKGGNWTNQFTVFEIRLPRPTGSRLSDVQRVQGLHGPTHSPVRTFVNAPMLATPLSNRSMVLILFYCCDEIKDGRDW